MSENIRESLPGIDELRKLTVEIISAHVSHNTVVSSDLPGMIGQVFGALHGLDRSPQPAGSAPVRLVPAVPVRKSITPDWLICLEDGLKLKMLKRHLRTAFGMSPDEYRERWGLPRDYPMVAPNYATERSVLAKAIGLGTRRSTAKRRPVAAAQTKRPSSRKPA